MKYIMIVPDGAADYPLEDLNGKTPMEVADTPHIDALTKKGQLGRVKTVPFGFSPSSDVANLSLLGYEPQKYYKGRGPLEAANLGVTLDDGDIAFRCNLITESEGKILDYSAGHIIDKEAKIIMEYIQENLGTPEIQFFHGTSYRNLMVYRKGARFGFDKLKYFPPHDVTGGAIEKNFPSGKNSEVLINIMKDSQKILRNFEINNVRIDLKENPANMIWLWGCGVKPKLPSFKEQFGLTGAVISAVDLIKGIGRLIGMDVIDVEGATGYYDTNYRGKAEAALKALQTVDFVFVHIEATDEAGHNKDLRMKIACMERIDSMVVGPIVEKMKGDYKVLIVPDHPTPVEKGGHSNEPVPFMISGSGIEPGGFHSFCENEAGGSNLYLNSGPDLMKYFLKK
jgi:2,3-bisphosphoglycerate-independent phosphoglycerate mutase